MQYLVKILNLFKIMRGQVKLTLVVGVFIVLACLCACKTRTKDLIIQIKGSDTMVNLVQGWAETYKSIAPTVTVEVSGGGTGVGIAALIRGTVDFASCSREIHTDEIENAKRATGKEPHFVVVGYDGIAIYVHKNNPLEEISLEELAAIFEENGSITNWSQLGVNVPGCAKGNIILVGRQSSSGTFVYFREHVLGNRDFKMNIRSMNGSKEVVELVSVTPCAIGYSGMGYASEHVKVLKVSFKKGESACFPTEENIISGKYPLARPLYLYWLGELDEHKKNFIKWILSDEGQTVVARTGYVPIPKDKRQIGD